MIVPVIPHSTILNPSIWVNSLVNNAHNLLMSEKTPDDHEAFAFNLALIESADNGLKQLPYVFAYNVDYKAFQSRVQDAGYTNVELRESSDALRPVLSVELFDN